MDKYEDSESQEAAYYALLRSIAQQQVDQNQGVARRFLLVHPQDGGQIYQSLQFYGVPTDYSDDVMETDSQSYFDQSQSPPSFTPSWITNENVQEKVEESDDEDEFETDQDAHNYAVKTSWELFEEIMVECTAELGKPGILDFDEAWRNKVCENLVFPEVWRAMGGTL